MLINASVQVVPIADEKLAIPVIDEAIAIIQQSGLKYNVGAFATDIEGPYEHVQGLLRQVEDFCYSRPEHQFLVYTKLHLSGGRDISIGSKVDKFR